MDSFLDNRGGKADETGCAWAVSHRAGGQRHHAAAREHDPGATIVSAGVSVECPLRETARALRPSLPGSTSPASRPLSLSANSGQLRQPVAAFDILPNPLIFKLIIRNEVEYCPGFHPA